jgi:ribosomal protein S18 acetylase RimI-like enzyme
MPESDVAIRRADLQDNRDADAVLDLLDMYARDPFGDGEPLATDVRERLIPDLRRLDNCYIFLAIAESSPVGLAICFFGYSSFLARPLLNIHDLAVVPEWRGRRVGRALLHAIEQEARRRHCCRITLEVRADNLVARRLYQDFGFQPGDTATDALSFWKKPLV